MEYVFLGVVLGSLVSIIYFLIRNRNVHIFLLDVLSLVSFHSQNQIKKGNLNWRASYNRFWDKLPGYYELIFKFWIPLKLESFFNKDEIDELLNV